MRSQTSERNVHNWQGSFLDTFDGYGSLAQTCIIAGSYVGIVYQPMNTIQSRSHMGQMGRIEGISDLPSARQLNYWHERQHGSGFSRHCSTLPQRSPSLGSNQGDWKIMSVCWLGDCFCRRKWHPHLKHATLVINSTCFTESWPTMAPTVASLYRPNNFVGGLRILSANSYSL